MAEGPVFVLAPPFGLGAHLAALLGRHPRFADLPAAHVMCADTPAGLARRWGDRLDGHDHGLVRAVARLVTHGDADAAAAWLADRADAPSGDVLAALTAAAAPRRLVDPSFLYAVDDGALPRIAAAFPKARFVHLLRHPAHVLPTPEAARARAEALWLRPHLRVHAFLAGRPPLTWLRLRVEWLAADPGPRLGALMDWLGEPRDDAVLDDRPSPFAARGPARAPHGVDPMLVADPGLRSLLHAPAAPTLDDAAWEAAGFDAEARAMARNWGYA